MEPTTAAIVVLAVLMLLVISAGAGLYRRVRELELATYKGVGLKFGATSGADGVPSIAVAGRRTVVVKVTRRCPACDEVLAAIRRVAPSYENELQFVVLTDEADHPDLASNLPERVRVISDPGAWRAVGVPYVPALLIVDEQGTVVHTTPAGSATVVEDCVRRAAVRGREAGA